MTDMTGKAAGAAGEGGSTAPEPTQAEIDAWAASEKKRREAWLNGPSDEERAEYAQHLRQRRLASTFDKGEARITDTVRMGVRYTPRDAAGCRRGDGAAVSLLAADLRRVRPGRSRVGGGDLPPDPSPPRVDG